MWFRMRRFGLCCLPRSPPPYESRINVEQVNRISTVCKFEFSPSVPFIFIQDDRLAHRSRNSPSVFLRKIICEPRRQGLENDFLPWFRLLFPSFLVGSHRVSRQRDTAYSSPKSRLTRLSEKSNHTKTTYPLTLIIAPLKPLVPQKCRYPHHPPPLKFPSPPPPLPL